MSCVAIADGAKAIPGTQTCNGGANAGVPTHPGEIDITYDPVGITQITLTTDLVTIVPSIQKQELQDGIAASSGNVDWGCSSATNATAAAQVTVVTLGTLLAKYAPTQCK